MKHFWKYFGISIGAVIVAALALVLVWSFGLEEKADTPEEFVGVSTGSNNTVFDDTALREIESQVMQGQTRIALAKEDTQFITYMLHQYATSMKSTRTIEALSVEPLNSDCIVRVVYNSNENLYPLDFINLKKGINVEMQVRFSEKDGKILIGIVSLKIGKSPVPAFIARPLIQRVADSLHVEYTDGYLVMGPISFNYNVYDYQENTSHNYLIKLTRFTNQFGRFTIDLEAS